MNNNNNDNGEKFEDVTPTWTALIDAMLNSFAIQSYKLSKEKNENIQIRLRESLTDLKASFHDMAKAADLFNEYAKLVKGKL